MKTVLETIDGGTSYLEKRGIEDARRNMQWLVAHQLGCTRMEIYTQFDRPLEENELAPLREALKKRGEGTPLQHLLGTVSFLDHDFICDGRALIPRPETEELAEWILSWDLPEQLRLLDMGCGSGVLGLSLAAARPGWQVTLADVSSDALALAHENAKALKLDEVKLVDSDLFSSINGPFDGIVANLPYVPEGERPRMAAELAHDPDLALFSGSDGLELIRRFIPEAFGRLTPGGWLALEIGHDQAAPVRTLLEQAGFTDIRVKTDLSGIERFPAARKPA
ncbi:MAG: peptide chain release factor N(5)-glutamine methyltransferase [Akkermansiaceae bacterium]|nr:peptide chain release factor N(5)-glutamine methyltransferase [Akkermansiaceae bacterium]